MNSPSNQSAWITIGESFIELFCTSRRGVDASYHNATPSLDLWSSRRLLICDTALVARLEWVQADKGPRQTKSR